MTTTTTSTSASAHSLCYKNVCRSSFTRIFLHSAFSFLSIFAFRFPLLCSALRTHTHTRRTCDVLKMILFKFSHFFLSIFSRQWKCRTRSWGRKRRKVFRRIFFFISFSHITKICIFILVHSHQLHACWWHWCHSARTTRATRERIWRWRYMALIWRCLACVGVWVCVLLPYRFLHWGVCDTDKKHPTKRISIKKETTETGHKHTKMKKKKKRTKNKFISFVDVWMWCAHNEIWFMIEEFFQVENWFLEIYRWIYSLGFVCRFHNNFCFLLFGLFIRALYLMVHGCGCMCWLLAAGCACWVHLTLMRQISLVSLGMPLNGWMEVAVASMRWFLFSFRFFAVRLHSISNIKSIICGFFFHSDDVSVRYTQHTTTSKKKKWRKMIPSPISLSFFSYSLSRYGNCEYMHCCHSIRNQNKRK